MMKPWALLTEEDDCGRDKNLSWTKKLMQVKPDVLFYSCCCRCKPEYKQSWCVFTAKVYNDSGVDKNELV